MLCSGTFTHILGKANSKKYHPSFTGLKLSISSLLKYLILTMIVKNSGLHRKQRKLVQFEPLLSSSYEKCITERKNKLSNF